MGKSAVLSACLARRDAVRTVVPHHFVRRRVATARSSQDHRRHPAPQVIPPTARLAHHAAKVRTPLSRSSTKHTILFLAANPIGTAERALDREARAIQKELERSGFRDRFELITRWAAEPMDLLRELRSLKPAIVHFCGSGGSESDSSRVAASTQAPRQADLSKPGDHNDQPPLGLFFQGPGGRPQLVSTQAIEQTFGAAGASVRLVVLSACYSDEQAKALLTHVGCVVGMRGTIQDEAARSFAVGFYGGLGELEPIAAAYAQGCAAISLEGLPDHDRPQLTVRADVDATSFALSTEPAAPLSASRIKSQRVPSERETLTNQAEPSPLQQAGSNTPIDLLLVTALTEEAQVVSALLSLVAKKTHEQGDATFYDYLLGSGAIVRVATASAHAIGAVSMGVFAAPLLKELQPRSAALVGIAAAVDPGEVALGDVPFASEVVSYDDIAVSSGTLTFRTNGYPTDPRMRRGVGELRTSLNAYRAWQEECRETIREVIQQINGLRRRQIRSPMSVPPPHLVVEIVAGGPFLLRDQDFRESLRRPNQEQSLRGLKVTSPVHPKLVSTEMESHGFMRAAHDHRVPATVIKGISDAGDEKKAKLEKETGGFYRAFACCNAVLSALHILQHATRRESPAKLPYVNPQ